MAAVILLRLVSNEQGVDSSLQHEPMAYQYLLGRVVWPLRIMIYFIGATMVEVDFFITMNFQTVVRGAQDHPTSNMISHFVPWPMIYSFLVSKHQKRY